MKVTKKIEVIIAEPCSKDKALYFERINEWRSISSSFANELVSFLYSVDTLSSSKIIDEESRLVLNILKMTGESNTEEEALSSLFSERVNGKLPSMVISAIYKIINATYQETKERVVKGVSTLPNYTNLPIPFTFSCIESLKRLEGSYDYSFTLFGIPFRTEFGRDRSNNFQLFSQIASGSVNAPSLSLTIDRRRGKLFLLICIDLPKKEVELIENNRLTVELSDCAPLVVSFRNRVVHIGGKEEFLYRRNQIIESARRASQYVKFSPGGKGRKRKLAALRRIHAKENEYINTKVHNYTKHVVEHAVKNKCKTICIVKHDVNDNNALILRSWGYYGLYKKLNYKAALSGISVRWG